MKQPRAFPALDGWRGLCALLVALLHFRAVLQVYVNSHLSGLALVRHAALFVDFFFVLSGFVIAHRYANRLSTGAISFADFMKLRFARLYPLHLFTLLLTVAIVLYLRFGATDASQVTWDGADVGVRAFVMNVLMVHGLHSVPLLSWNHPSWSVSTEFATYAVFGLIWVGLRQRAMIAVGLVAFLAPLAIFALHGNIEVTYDWGILRSAFGFSAGVWAFKILEGRAKRPLFASLMVTTVVEVALVAGVVAFVTYAAASPVSLLAPVLFATVVLVFADGRGALSTALETSPMQALGRWSYSIYLLHFPLQLILMQQAVAIASKGADSLFAVTDTPNGPMLVLGRTPWVGDLATLLMVALLIGCSALSYRWIEQPWRRRARQAMAAGS